MAKSLTAREDGDLVERARAILGVISDEGVASLMIGSHLLFLGCDNHTTLLSTHDDLVLGPLEIPLSNRLSLQLAGVNSSLVDNVLQLGTGKTRSPGSDSLEVDISGSLDALGVVLENGHAATDIGKRNNDVAIETTRTGKRLIKGLGEVGGTDDDHTTVLLETVQLGKKLVESLTHVGGVPGVTPATDSVKFVDENNRGSLGLGGSKEITNTLCADTDVDLFKFRARHVEERDTSFASNRTSQKSFTSTGGSNEQHTLGELATKSRVLLGVAQEVNEFLELFLGLVATVDISEASLLVLGLDLVGLQLATGALDAAQALEDHSDDNHAEIGEEREPHEKLDPTKGSASEAFINHDMQRTGLGTSSDRLDHGHVTASMLSSSGSTSGMDLASGETGGVIDGVIDRSVVHRRSIGLTGGDGESALVDLVYLLVSSEASRLISLDNDSRHVRLKKSLVEGVLSTGAGWELVGSSLASSQKAVRKTTVSKVADLESETERGVYWRAEERRNATGLVSAHGPEGVDSTQGPRHERRERAPEERVRHSELTGRHAGDFRKDVCRRSIGQTLRDNGLKERRVSQEGGQGGGA